MLRSALAAVLTAVLVIPSVQCGADTLVPAIPIAVNGAPFKITSCSVRSYPGDENLKQLYAVAAEFKNTGRKKIEALEVSFELHRLLPDSDEAQSHIYSHVIEKYEPETALAPGESDVVRSDGNSFFEKMKLRRAECFPVRAVFSDGSTWKNHAYDYHFQ